MRLGETSLEVVVADITTLSVDAIVNAANAAFHSIDAARNFESLAFSAVSTGVYGFPTPRAARIAVETTKAALAGAPAISAGSVIRRFVALPCGRANDLSPDFRSRKRH